jgi:glutaminase
MDLPSIAEQADWPHVSTGHLPAAETVQKLVPDAHRRFKSNTGSQNSQVSPAQVSPAQVYPALARLPCDLFGVCDAGCASTLSGGSAWSTPAPLTLLAPY